MKSSLRAYSSTLVTVTLDVNGNGKLFFKSQVTDYGLRGESLSTSNVMDFLVNTYKADIDKREKAIALAKDDETDVLQCPKRGKPLHEHVHYLASHPKYKAKQHIVQSQHHNTLPNFIGQYFPHSDDEDQQSFYYASMLTLLKPWRNLQTDLKHPSQMWEEAFNAFCAVASPRDLRVISNIQYFHKCEAGAKHKGFKPTTTQIAPGDVPPGELELDEDILHCKHDEEFMEDGLAYLIASKKSWREELHGRLAIEAAKEGCVFSDMLWDGSPNIPGNETTSDKIGGPVKRATEVDIENLLSWKQQMERDVQGQNSSFLPIRAQDHSDSPNTATVTCNNGTGLGGVTYNDPETNAAAEASLPPINPSMLKADQHHAYDIVTGHLDQTLSGCELPPLRMLIHGEGGTGKSKVIQTITEYFMHRGVTHMLLKAAYTGVAASFVNGKTTHTIAMVSVGKDTMISNKSKKLQQFWKHISYLIIDEMSMLTKKFLAILSCNISIGKMVEGQPSKNESFGRINVILCRDFHQFPPVATSPTEALYFPSNPTRDSTESQLGRAIYEEFSTVIIFKEQMRVTDPVWHNFLEHLRYGQVKEEDIMMLQTLIITNPNSTPTDFKSPPWDSASLVTHGMLFDVCGMRRPCVKFQEM